MLTVFRHTLSILLLPVLVVIGMPYWLLSAFTAIDTRWTDGSFIGWMARFTGVTLMLFGLVFFVWCVALFARVGKGTLAPWDPTSDLVAVGPYRIVRNPMISSVALMLIGQAVFFGSWLVSLWAGVFVMINHLYFINVEEPGLERRFGERYRLYKAKIPRWLPHLNP